MKWFLLVAVVLGSFHQVAAQAETNSIAIKPGLPAYLRQGDHTELSTSIQNHSDHEITGQVQLELIDSSRNQSVDGWFLNTFPNQYFTVAAGKSEEAKFPVQVPMQFANKLLWKISVAWDSNRVQKAGSMTILADTDTATEDNSPRKTVPLHFSKKMFLVKRTASGRKITPVEDQIALQVGDTIEVQIALQTDKDLKLVHIKDGLASGTEFLSELSKAKTGSYDLIADTTSANFSFRQIKKGSLALKYLLLVTSAGNFSTGNTMVQFNSGPGIYAIGPAQRLNIE